MAVKKPGRYEITLTKEDVEAAIMSKWAAISECCPIFQALKREGFEPSLVGGSIAYDNHNRIIEFVDVARAMNITDVNAEHWFKIPTPQKIGIRLYGKGK